MKTTFLAAWLTASTMFVATVYPASSTAEVTSRHVAHKKTAERVGVGAAGGAVIGALAGGGKGAAIGALAGGGTGYVYDRHKKNVAKRNYYRRYR